MTSNNNNNSNNNKSMNSSSSDASSSTIYGMTHMGKKLFSKINGKASITRQKPKSAAAAAEKSSQEFLAEIARENECLDMVEKLGSEPTLAAAPPISSDDLKKKEAQACLNGQCTKMVDVALSMSTTKESTDPTTDEIIRAPPMDDAPVAVEDRVGVECTWTCDKFGFDFGSYPSVCGQPYFELFVSHLNGLGINKFYNSQKNLIARMLQGQSFQVTSACGSGKSFAFIGAFVGCMAKDATLVWVYDRKGNHTPLRNQMTELISSMSGGELTAENGSVVDFGSADAKAMGDFEQVGRVFPKIALTPCAMLSEVLRCIEGHVVIAFDECQTIFNEVEEFALADKGECMMHSVSRALSQDFTGRRSRPFFQVVCMSAVGDLVEKKIRNKKGPNGPGFRSVSTVVSEFFDHLGAVGKVDGQSMPVVNVKDDHGEWLETFVVHLLDHEAIYEQSLHIAMKLLSPGRNIFVVRDGGQLAFYLDFIRQRGLTVTSNWDKWSDPTYRIILVRDNEVGMLQGQNIHDLTGVYIFTLPPNKDLHLSFQAIGRVGRLSQIGTQTRAIVFMDKSGSRQQWKESSAQAILDRYLKEEYQARVVKLQTHKDHKELDLGEFGFSIVDLPIVPIVETTEPDLGNRLYLCPNPFDMKLLRQGDRPRCSCKREHPYESSVIKWIGTPPRAYLDENRYLATAPEPAYNVYNTMPSLCIQCAFGQCCDGLSSRLIHFGNARFNEVSETYLRKFVENNVCVYGFFGDEFCVNEHCSEVHRGDDRLTRRVEDLCVRYFLRRGVCSCAYYWKECECDISIQPHIGYDDPRLDVAIGDDAHTLRERLVDDVARKNICMFGCYDRSRCTLEECRKQHSGDRPLLDACTVRAFRRVYLEKYGSKMRKCRVSSEHDILLCPYYHVPEDTKMDDVAWENARVASRSKSSDTSMSVIAIGSASTSSSARSQIGTRDSGEVDKVDVDIEAVVGASSPEVIYFGSFATIIDDGDEIGRKEQEDILSLPVHLSSVMSSKPVEVASSPACWSKAAAIISRPLSDVMREEEEEKLAAARRAATAGTTCNGNTDNRRKPLLSSFSRSPNTAALQESRGYGNMWNTSHTNPMIRNVTATSASRSSEATTSLQVSVSGGCVLSSKGCVSLMPLDDNAGEWKSVEKKAKVEASMGPKDKRIVCSECRGVFWHTVDDQKFFASMNWTTIPTRCKQCREKKKKRVEKWEAGKK